MARRKNKQNDEPTDPHEDSAELNFAPDEKDAPTLGVAASNVMQFAPSGDSAHIGATLKPARPATAEGAKRVAKAANSGTNAKTSKKNAQERSGVSAKRSDNAGAAARAAKKDQANSVPAQSNNVLEPALEASTTMAPYYVGSAKLPGFVARRATDLLLPALDPTTVRIFTMADFGLDKLIADVEAKDYTGCIKVNLYQSRGCIVLFRGTVVGSIYTSKTNPMTLPTEHSLIMSMSTLLVSDASVLMYKLPDSIVLPTSSLFIGHPVQNDQNKSVDLGYLRKWFANKRSTAVIAVTIGGHRQTCLIFYFDGKFVGSFLVERQLYSEDYAYTQSVLAEEGIDNVESSVLSSPVTGISMSQVRKRWKTAEPR